MDGIKTGCVNNVKELWGCDVVLKKRNDNDEILIFLREIPDAIIIDETSESTPTE